MKTLRKARPVKERLFARVVVDAERGCWIWTGATKEFGHGVIGVGRRAEGIVRVHRLSWELHRSPIPAGMQVNHHCDVPACVNPEHLYLGTQADNMRDVSVRERFSMPAAKINGAAVRAIRLLRGRGVSPRLLSEVFDIQPRTIRKIVARDRWRHVG